MITMYYNLFDFHADKTKLFDFNKKNKNRIMT